MPNDVSLCLYVFLLSRLALGFACTTLLPTRRLVVSVGLLFSITSRGKPLFRPVSWKGWKGNEKRIRISVFLRLAPWPFSGLFSCFSLPWLSSHLQSRFRTFSVYHSILKGHTYHRNLA